MNMNKSVRVNSKGQIIEELDVHLCDIREPMVSNVIVKSDDNNSNKKVVINELEILTWCEIYLAAKKSGGSLYPPLLKKVEQNF